MVTCRSVTPLPTLQMVEKNVAMYSRRENYRYNYPPRNKTMTGASLWLSGLWRVSRASQLSEVETLTACHLFSAIIPLHKVSTSSLSGWKQSIYLSSGLTWILIINMIHHHHFEDEHCWTMNVAQLWMKKKNHISFVNKLRHELLIELTCYVLCTYQPVNSIEFNANVFNSEYTRTSSLSYVWQN